MTATRFRIGDWVLDSRLNRLEDDAGETQRLEPLGAELLCFLARHPGRVVSVDDLLSEVWTGKIVTDSSVYRLIADLRRSLGDSAQSPRYIETVRKRGYRLVADVTPLPEAPPPAARSAPTGSSPESGGESPGANPRSRPRRLFAGTTTLMLVLFVGAITASGWLLVQRQVVDPAATPAGPVIAVLPPVPLSESTPDYLVEGIGRTISNRLAAIPELTVIAYPSVGAAARTSDDPKAIAERVGADLVLAGTVLAGDDPSDPRLRYNASLLSADDAIQLWSRQFDVAIADLFALHDAVAGGIARELDLQLATPARERVASRTVDPRSISAYLEGQQLLATGYQSQSLMDAIARFDAALAADGDLVPALAARAIAHLRLFMNYHDRSDTRLRLARNDVDRALSLQPDSAPARYALGYLLGETARPERAREELNRALQLQPSNAEIQIALSKNLARAGEADAAIEAALAAVRLDPFNALYRYELGLLEFNDGRFPAADAHLASAISLAPDMVEPYIYRAWLEIAWRADVAAANARLADLGTAIGDDELMRLLMTAGLWGVFTWSDPALDRQLAEWSTEESGGDPAVWHLAMAEVAKKRGDTAAMQRHHAAAVAQRERDVRQQADSPWLLAELAIARAGLGLREDALRAADRAIALSPVTEDEYDGVDFLWIRATVLAMLGDDLEAIEQVRAAARYPTLTTPNALRIDRHWDALFEYPEFVALMSEDGSEWRVSPAANAASADAR